MANTVIDELLAEKLYVTRWTFWEDDQYPKSGFENDGAYMLAIARHLRTHGYRFSGDDHENYRYGVPVMSDGTKYCSSERHWGRIMAMAYELQGERAYTEWAFLNTENPVFPRPEDWGAEPDSYCDEYAKEHGKLSPPSYAR